MYRHHNDDTNILFITCILSSFLLQCEGIIEFWEENKISNINYRLTVPIFVGLMGGGHITSIVVRYAIGILLFGLCGKIIYNYTKDRTSALLFSMKPIPPMLQAIL